jgi:AraC-like DNA-binding protein
MILPQNQGYPFKFTDSTHDSFMENMALLLRAKYVDGQIFLPPFIGSGFLKKIHVEDGLSIRNIDFTLDIDFPFDRIAKKEEDEKIFQLYYFLNNTDFRFTLEDEKEPLRPSAFANTILLSNDMSVHGKFRKNDSVKAIVISVSLSWLQKNGFETYQWFKPFLNTKNISKGLLMLESLEVADFSAARELNNVIIPDAGFVFSIKADAFLLIKRFFDAIEKRHDHNLHKSHSGYFFEMVKVENRISEYLNDNLPQIKTLSKEFNMSESNLKRHFRIVYGKNIYEYYLEKKMGLAKEMLMNQGTAISSVAYSLGYEKVSSFTKAFKKLYGVLPSDLRNNKNIQIGL